MFHVRQTLLYLIFLQKKTSFFSSAGLLHFRQNEFHPGFLEPVDRLLLIFINEIAISLYFLIQS